MKGIIIRLEIESYLFASKYVNHAMTVRILEGEQIL